MLEPDTEVVIVLPAPTSEEVTGPEDEAGPEVLDGVGAGKAVVPEELIEVVSGDTMLLLAEVAGAAEVGTVVISVVAAEEPE